MPVNPPFNVYRDQLTALSHGLALWNPKPPKKFYSNVSIGDVGYLHKGTFIRMFNVMLPWDDPLNKTLGDPEFYEPLNCGPSRTLEDNFDRVEHCSRYVSIEGNVGNMQAITPDDAEGVTYKFRNRGALLSLPNGGRHEDIIRTKAFEDYIRDHVVSWYTWAQKNKLGVERMEELILVSGCTLVTSWAAAVFVDNTMKAEISLASRALSNGGVSFVWSNNQGAVVYHNSRFDPQNPPTTLDQCVFIRGFRAKRVLFWTKRIRAGAEPLPDDPDNRRDDEIQEIRGSGVLERVLFWTRRIRGALSLPDNPDNRRDDEIQVTQVPNVPKYRDPLVGVLDYIAEKCVKDAIAEDTIAITHDNDLQLMEGMETLTADAIEKFLREKRMPLLVKDGAAILCDPRNNEPPVSVKKKTTCYVARGTSQTPTESREGRPRFPSTLQRLLSNGLSRGGPSQPNRSTLMDMIFPETTQSRVQNLSMASRSIGSGIMPARVLSKDSASSYLPLTSGHPSSPFGADSSDLHHPHCVETRLHQYRSRGSCSPQLNRSMSVDTGLPQGARSHSYSRMNRTRTASVSLLDYEHPPSSTQFKSWPALGAGQMPTKRHEGLSRFPSTLRSRLSDDFRFNLLVVGKPESGKSSLIDAVFKVDMSKGTQMNASPRTVEFRPHENDHLVVYECSGFEPGDLQVIRDYITTRNHKSRPASERLHAIWICVPMLDAIDMQFDESVRTLLGVGVPFVLVFTKFDMIFRNVSSNIAGRNDYERARATACEEYCRSLFGNVPAEIVSTRQRFRDLIEKLVTTTDEVIIAHSRHVSASSEAQMMPPRIFPVPLAWSVSQRTSRDINAQAAIEVGRSRYWCLLGSSDDFAGQTLADCAEVIHADIVDVWNLPDEDKYLSSRPFKTGISRLVQDLSGSQPNGPPGTGAAWLNDRYENTNENICIMMGYIVNLTLVLCRVFRSPGNVSPSEVQSVMNNFAGSSLKTSIHAEIKSFLRTVPLFEYHNKDVVMEKIIELIRQYCDLPGCQ